ncbi:hypothetical protein HANVADRAFT_53033 [Hanseniaspora valbyensis NRRL Y-1626]|uniref:Single hybrid motif-containing protein n=1 Tax=Hanseniaspora valbyensis NRRL Y-1626 TaxID=766949 RepID=A0A1B7TCT8_9ASCO|nr:hypothetical protein HANVADRAFT_53033 [Hanseniaspora valbyensis NRRL Y-1626]
MLSRSTITRVLNQTAKFHTRSNPLLKAIAMEMPAMSPTMTEGGVVEWKVQPGDKFVSGDILVEIETDKATIDVEALDDGIMGKIIVNNGAKGIPVGEPIAVLAEEDDDLSTLDLDAAIKKSSPKKTTPPPTAEKAAAAPAEVKETKKVEEPKKQEKTVESTSNDDKSLFKKADPNQTLYPSVIQLLHLNNISTEKALAEIPATGPKGKLLKGDVLLYLQMINKDTYVKLNEYLQKGTTLDLSNIELRQPELKKEGEQQAGKDSKPIILEPIVLRAEVKLPPLSENVYFEDVEEIIYEKLQKLERDVYKLQALRSEYYDSAFESLVSKRYSESLFEFDWSLRALGSNGRKAKQFDAFDELFGTSKKNVSSSKQDDAFDGVLSLNVTVDLGISPSQDAVLKAQQFIKKVETLF